MKLIVEGELVSQPYVDHDAGRDGGIRRRRVQPDDLQRFRHRRRQRYQGRRYAIEPDASAASYFWAAAAITGGRVTVEGLTRRSVCRATSPSCECLRADGLPRAVRPNADHGRRRPLRGIDVDMNAISDTVQTLAVVALFAEGPTTIRGVAHIRHKETDRIGDLAVELRKLGAAVDECARRAADSARSAARRGDRNLQRPPHGDEPRLGRAEDSRRGHPESGLHAQDVSEVLRRPQPGLSTSIGRRGIQVGQIGTHAKVIHR